MAKKPSSNAPTALHPLAGAVLSPPAADHGKGAIPIRLVEAMTELSGLETELRNWLHAQAFNPAQRRLALVAGPDGKLTGVIMGAASTSRHSDPLARPELLAGQLAAQLPPANYHFATSFADPELAAVAWGLGAYRFRRYKSAGEEPQARLVLGKNVDPLRVAAIVTGTAFGRDLINTPANDLGPAEIEDATRALAKSHGAKVSSIVGDDLLSENFPLIHAVGRASPRAPRLIDLIWQPAGSSSAKSASLPKVTLVGKGIAFDTGGLDLKPPGAMLIMKKDMGGAAAALATAHMVMAANLPVRLRVLIAAAENSVSGNAFRPLDVIKSRAGLTVEIGNTDAEGRLVLADALALADEESPEMLLTFSTLTGAARTALGPDLAPYFTDDDVFASEIAAAGLAVADPVWRLPFWTAYEPGLDSAVADFGNVAEGPFAGAIIAAVFLRKFVRLTQQFAHFDIYGWRPATRPLGPRGGEVNASRAVFALLAQRYPVKAAP